jgi:hypothetical protein
MRRAEVDGITDFDRSGFKAEFMAALVFAGAREITGGEGPGLLQL